MSKRPFDTSFWTGKYVRSLSAHEKFLYAYLINNPLGTIAGIYEEQADVFAFDTKLPEEEVLSILSKLEKDGKIVRTGGKVALTKWCKHQAKNPDVITGIIRELKALSPQERYTLSQGGYTLPTGCRWNDLEEATEAEKYPVSVQPVDSLGTARSTIPNQTNTLPNHHLTPGGGGGGGEKNGSVPDDMVEPWYESPENVLGLSQWEVMAMDRPEYESVYVDDEYRKVCEDVRQGKLTVKNPRRFFESRLESIYESSRNGR